MARHKDTSWSVQEKPTSWEECAITVLMDIRDELKALNRVFGCHNFQSIPKTLKRFDRRMAKFSPLKKRQRKK